MEEYYLEVICCLLRYAMLWHRPNLWATGNWLLHQDIPSAILFIWFRRFYLTKYKILVLCQCHISPNMPPCDVCTFGSSSGWMMQRKGVDLNHEMTLFRTRPPSCTPFPMRSSSWAFNNGKNAGKRVCNLKQSNFKAIRVSDLQVSILRVWTTR